MIKKAILAAELVAVCGLVAAPTFGQDSVASSPGSSDALSAYGTQTVRYIVDLAPITSSWGNEFYVGPIAKASADPDALFPTMVLGAAAMSPDHLENLTFGSTNFSVWSTPGQGVNPAENDAPSSLAVTGFDRQFGLAFNDLSAESTNVVGLLVGQDEADTGRLYVTRTVAACSRVSAGGDDSSTLSLGAIDATGNLLMRADDFSATGSGVIVDDNIVHIDLLARSGSVNTLVAPAGTNLATDLSATSYIINAETTTTNTPTILPEDGANPFRALVLDFSNDYRIDGGAGATSHLDSDVEAHRGNPHYADLVTFGGVGTFASLARSNAGGGKVDSFNVGQVSSAGAISFPSSTTLPSPITEPGGFSTNAAGDAEFHHYLSQLSFRGANGPVAISKSGSNAVFAGTANDPTDGEFIATSTFTPGTPIWSIAAHAGKPVLDSLLGAAIGTLEADVPTGLSSPGMDRFGNVYFVSAWSPNGGGSEIGFFKAHPSPIGYRLELLLSTGDVVSGQNSGRDYTIESIRLADADSLASGAFHAASVLQPPVPGHESDGATSSFAFGGAAVNATITYDNGGAPESYEAVLYVGPRPVPPAVCDGDANGDNMVNFDDLNLVLSNWGTAGPDGDIFPAPGGDGAVNFDDLNFVLGNWGESCL
ncbi:MAG: hypothetical protein RIB32_03575 [Phycisphaerales bacterium]